MLCCLLKPTRGTARVLGFDVNKESRAVKQVIGVSPQETTLSERLNPLENLELIARLRGISPDKARNGQAKWLRLWALRAEAKTR
jgi:ABC-2 type transport system ATP-binding protein